MKSSVIALIFNSDKTQVLLIKRRDVPVWVFPGGGIDSEESPEAAVVRECHEETGLLVETVRKIGEYTPINRLSNLTHVFECKAVGGSLSTGSETRDIRFYALGNMPETFFIVHQDWLKDGLKQDPEIIRGKISSVTYGALLKFFCRHPILVLRFALSRLGMPINSK